MTNENVISWHYSP